MEGALAETITIPETVVEEQTTTPELDGLSSQPAEGAPRKPLRNLRRKDLLSQLTETEAVAGEPLFADEQRTEAALALDTQQLKERYPLRYIAYLKMLRAAAAHRADNRALVRAMAGGRVPGADEDALSRLDPNQIAETRLDLETDPVPLVREDNRHHDFLSVRNYIRMMKSLETYRDSYQTDRPHGILRPHQLETVDDLITFLNAGYHRGYIDMPTGSGKTGVFVELVKALAKDREGADDHTPVKTLIIVPKKDLVRQTVGHPEEGGFARFASEMRVTSYYESSKDLSGEVVVTTYQSLVTNLMQPDPATGKPKIAQEHFDLVISDEAHYALGEKSNDKINQLMELYPGAMLVGLTATPDYSPDERRQVRRIFEHLIHRLGLAEAIRRQILAPLAWEFFTTNDEIVVKGRNNLMAGEDYSPAVLRQLNNERRNQEGVKIAQAEIEAGRQVLISCLPMDRETGQNHVQIMAELCNGATVRVRNPETGELTEETRPMRFVAITAETPEGDREQLYKDFRAGKIDGFCFIDVLKEGVDLPSAKALINLRPTPSPVLAKQRAGRVLRATGQTAKIIEFIDRFKSNKPYTVKEMFGDDEIVIDRDGQGGHVWIERSDGPRVREPEQVVSAPDGVELGVDYLPGGSIGLDSPPSPPAQPTVAPELTPPPGPVVRPEQIRPAGPDIYEDGDQHQFATERGLVRVLGLTPQGIATLEQRLGLRRIAKDDEFGVKRFVYDLDAAEARLREAPVIDDIAGAYEDRAGNRWLTAGEVTSLVRSKAGGVRFTTTDLMLALLRYKELNVGTMIGVARDEEDQPVYRDLYRLDDIKRVRDRLGAFLFAEFKKRTELSEN